VQRLREIAERLPDLVRPQPHTTLSGHQRVAGPAVGARQVRQWRREMEAAGVPWPLAMRSGSGGADEVAGVGGGDGTAPVAGSHGRRGPPRGHRRDREARARRERWQAAAASPDADAAIAAVRAARRAQRGAALLSPFERLFLSPDQRRKRRAAVRASLGR